MQKLSEIIKKAQNGDKEAFGHIYRLYYQKIYRYTMYNLNSEALALDITQETFLKAWKALPSFKQTTNGTLQAFLFKITKNLIIDNSRRKKAHSLENYKNLESTFNVEETFEKSANLEELKKALNKLNDNDKSIIVLHYLEGLPHAEVAKIVGIKDGALRVRTHRALQKLKNLLES